jgi:hypothetical protein
LGRNTPNPEAQGIKTVTFKTMDLKNIGTIISQNNEPKPDHCQEENK